MPTLKDLEHLKDRGDIANLLNRFEMWGDVAEIGVDMGHYAFAILKMWKGHKYYAVDFWDKQDPSVYNESGNFDFPKSYQMVRDLAKHDHRLVMMKMMSVEAAKLIPDRSLDWVWIDANHQHDPVLLDMDTWFPKVRPGGVFSGHDYWQPQLKSAVDSWMEQHGIKFAVVDSSWWSVKP